MLRVLQMLERHSNWLLLTYRFLYGIRNVTSLAVGMSRVPALKFTLLNAIGAAVWAVSFGLGGYLFGEALFRLVEGAHKYQRWGLVGAAAAGVLIWLVRLIWMRRRRPAPPPVGVP